MEWFYWAIYWVVNLCHCPKFPDRFLVCHVSYNSQKKLDEDTFQANVVEFATNGG